MFFTSAVPRGSRSIGATWRSRICGTMTSQNTPTPQPPSSVVLYHYPCPDGVFAALAAHLALSATGARARFIPHTVYSPLSLEALPIGPSDCVYLLDYAGPPGFAVALAQRAGRVVVLDHHKTAAEQLSHAAVSATPNLDVTFDMECSGATIAREHFQPQLTPAQRQLFDYIEDFDLWRFALPNTKAFQAGLVAQGLDWDANTNPEIWEQLLRLEPESLISHGDLLLAEQQRKMDEILSTSYEVELGGEAGRERGWGRCLAVRGDAAPSLRSDLGHQLADKSETGGLRAIGVVAYIEPAMADENKIKCSLRSTGDEDTTVIAKAFGGGGHRNASSFIVDLAEFERWRMQS